MRKLRGDRGETLIEVLAAILIAILSVTLLFSCVLASTEMDKNTARLDETHYSALSEAEAPMAAPVLETTVKITGGADSDPAKPSVEIYGGGDMFSYKVKP